MQTTHRDRWEHAKQATISLERWKLRAVEAFVVAAGTYFLLRYFFSAGEAMPHLLALAFAAVAGLVVFPIFEFAGNYLNAPRAIKEAEARAEMAELRAENARLREAIPKATPSDAPPKVYLTETPSEIMRRLSTLRWNEKEVVFDASYAGRWIRGTGTIQSITPLLGGSGQGLSVSLHDKRGETISLRCERSERPVLELMNEGDIAEYEGCVLSGGDLRLGISLYFATVRLI